MYVVQLYIFFLIFFSSLSISLFSLVRWIENGKGKQTVADTFRQSNFHFHRNFFFYHFSTFIRSMIPRYIGTAASIEALTSIRGLNVEEDVLLEDADDSELVALADDTTPGTPASEASGGARYCTI